MFFIFKASITLFTLPAKAKINIKTLSLTYPSDSGKQALTLSATQLISLHLFLNRPSGEEPSPDPLFGPYISVLPRDFDSHPLTWFVRQELTLSTVMEHNLLRSMPHSVHSALSRIATRFHEDWRTVRKYMPVRVGSHETSTMARENARSHEPARDAGFPMGMAQRFSPFTLLRYDMTLTKSRGDNLSLCPVFDFANHAWTAPNMDPVNLESEGGRWRDPRGSRGELVCVSTMEGAKDEELFITYGAHANRTLFVEYGFINDVGEDDISSGVYPGEVDVHDVMEELIESCAVASWIKSTLEDEGYWGYDNTLRYVILLEAHRI
ncbi:hypothetical protein EWM64_g1923 [Hericium alpestre]|uniref:SET domain-containing protein n=1 Tax=Hericium alpestre TaxID=135208 RepID=A0A4Z0A922_9AGAM|nr:hypothetical protein EWM64_g1923 [Hericium alpestre]